MSASEDARRKATRPAHGDEADLFREFDPRLARILQDPPLWLRRAIGKRPSIQSERAVLARRRAALAIDDYRREYGHGLGNDPLGERPAGREAARAFDLASSAIDQAVRARTRRRGRGVER